MTLEMDETIDEFTNLDLRIIQGRNGYRISLDPLLLCAFARVKEKDSVVDLGTGAGVIPLLLARRTDGGRLVGVEIQADLADRARRNVALNGLEGRIEILHHDLRAVREILPAQGFQVVLANPPFRQPGNGRLSPAGERAAARHELAGNLEDFLKAAGFLLGDGGRFFVVFLAERLADLLEGMRLQGLEPKRLRTVHGRVDDPARMVLVEGRKRGRPGLKIEPPFFIYEGGGYGAEVRSIYGEGV